MKALSLQVKLWKSRSKAGTRHYTPYDTEWAGSKECNISMFLALTLELAEKLFK